jgi:protein-arginine kinase activator protein McsA
MMMSEFLTTTQIDLAAALVRVAQLEAELAEARKALLCETCIGTHTLFGEHGLIGCPDCKRAMDAARDRKCALT